jgi:hypothetical protein
VQRLQRHQHLHGRAVGVGDDVVLLITGDRVRVDLGDHQRNVVLVTKLRGVVDDHAARLAGAHRVHLGNTGAGGKQADLGFAEIERLDVQHREFFTLEADRFADRFGARQRIQFADRKIALFQDRQHVAADQARRPQYRYIPPSAHRPILTIAALRIRPS